MTQLASIQYDIYQRYTVLADAFDAVFPPRGKPFRVLDVGSGPESLAKRFLDGRFEVVSCDVDDFGNPSIVKVQPGQPLPFADGEFDAVVCMDVLEHLPEPARAAFVAQLARVGSGLVAIAFPHSEDAVRHGERLLDRGYLDLWGKHCDFLVEHEEFGLPRISDATKALKAAGLAMTTVGVSRLDEWLLYSYMDILCLSLFGVGLEKDDLNRRFNDVARADRDPDGHYRALILASRDARTVRQVEAALFGAASAASMPQSASFSVAVNAFDACRYLTDRLRSKSFKDVYSVVAHDLARIGGERAEHEKRLEECVSSLAQVSGSLAEVRADRDALAARVAALTQELSQKAQQLSQKAQELSQREQKLAQQAQAHEAALREAQHESQVRAASLESAFAELEHARRRHVSVAASNEMLSRDLDAARGKLDEHAAIVEAERSAGQARLQRLQYLLDIQTVASGKLSARLRCERRARLLDIRQLEVLSRRN
jgi:hypothetical protein